MYICCLEKIDQLYWSMYVFYLERYSETKQKCLISLYIYKHPVLIWKEKKSKIIHSKHKSVNKNKKFEEKKCKKLRTKLIINETK